MIKGVFRREVMIKHQDMFDFLLDRELLSFTGLG